jgi:F-type H+-transporting ATPase subunit a
MTPPIILAAAREGFKVPGISSFYGRPIVKMHLFGIDLSINRTVIILMAATVLVALFFTLAFARPKLVPRGFQNIIEVGIDFVRDQIVLPVIGPEGLSFLPYLSTLFFFVFFCNIFEVIPGLSFPATSRIGIPIVLALVTWVVFNGVGIKAQGFGHYLKASVVPSGVPWPILILLIPLEFLSVFVIRPVSLAVRLTANLIAGHLLLTVFFLGTAYLYGRDLTWGFGFVSMLAGAGFVGFETIVCGLQAFVFTILTAVYISGSRQAAH